MQKIVLLKSAMLITSYRTSQLVQQSKTVELVIGKIFIRYIINMPLKVTVTTSPGLSNLSVNGKERSRHRFAAADFFFAREQNAAG